jgi:methionyl-tRNA formyltransferase
MGSPEIAATCLRALAAAHDVALVVTQPDQPAGRGRKLIAPAVKLAAVELALPVIQPKSARNGELERALRDSGAELAAVVAYGKLLPRAVLDATPRGCINVHASLLPAYRGAAPVQWAVVRGEAETGVSIMQLDEGMDTGPVYFTDATPIGADETSGELLERLASLGATALVRAIAQIAAGARPVAQDHARASLAPMLAKRDGAIDFTAPATEVAARIRGVDPWPGAHALLRAQVVKLFHARAVHAHPEGRPQPPPGTVLAIAGDGVRVACGAGDVVIRELQPPGKRRMAAQSVANGRGLAVLDVFSVAPDAAEPPA